MTAPLPTIMLQYRSLSAPPLLIHSSVLKALPSLTTPSRTSSISSSSSSIFKEDLFKSWHIPPPSRRQSVTEGIEPYVHPERYDPRPALKCRVEFRTNIWREEKRDEAPSPLVSPKGTEWDDLERDRMVEVECLRDMVFEDEERKEKREDDERYRGEFAEKRRELRGKGEIRKKRDRLRRSVADWGIVKGTFGAKALDFESDCDLGKGEGGLGKWWEIALWRSRSQRQLLSERSEEAYGENDSGDDEKSARVSNPFS
ncbi:MAG: hypothetical protein Q9171_006812 [Xanthocarpia ochracea]